MRYRSIYNNGCPKQNRCRIEQNEQTNQNHILSAKLYCRLAMDRLTESLDHLFSKQDEFIEEVSDQLTGIKYP